MELTTYYMTHRGHTIHSGDIAGLAKEMRSIFPRARTVEVERWNTRDGQSELIWHRKSSLARLL